jgi:Tfp pilus assembly protein PilZ
VTPVEELVDKGEPVKLPMLDVSAGGTSGRTRTDFGVGDAVLCEFSLPGVGNFEVTARVARVIEDRAGSKPSIVGFEFMDIGADEQASLRRWIYREEARRHRAGKQGRGRERKE